MAHLPEYLRGALPENYRALSFLDGVAWIQGLVGALICDDRIEGETSTDAMKRLYVILADVQKGDNA